MTHYPDGTGFIRQLHSCGIFRMQDYWLNCFHDRALFYAPVGSWSTIGMFGFLNSDNSKNVLASRFTQKPIQSSFICPILRNPFDVRICASLLFSETRRFKCLTSIALFSFKVTPPPDTVQHIIDKRRKFTDVNTKYHA